jgi:peptidoglycan hydrolase-like protein with peptidoglycan-binding domain
MFLVTKAACAGIAFLLLTTGISGPRSTPVASRGNLIEVRSVGHHRNDVQTVQETLHSKGDYRGAIDGVFGLRTQAGIRAYQKAENLPVTGELDTETAGKLGVMPEGREEIGYETAPGKPSAGIKWAKGSTNKTLRKAVKPVGPDRGRAANEKTLQAESDNNP